MQTFVKLQPITKEQLAADCFTVKYKTPINMGRVMARIFKKKMPRESENAYEHSMPSTAWRMVNMLQDIFMCIPDTVAKLPFRCTFDENGFWLVDRQACIKHLGVCGKTVERGFRKLEIAGLLERIHKKTEWGHTKHWMRFRWDNMLRICRGKKPVILEKKKKYTRHRDDPARFFKQAMAPKTEDTTVLLISSVQSEPDCPEDRSSEEPVVPPGFSLSLVEKQPASPTEVSSPEESSIPEKATAFDQVFESVKGWYDEMDWTPVRIHRLRRLVNHPIPIYRFTPLIAREMVSDPSDFFTSGVPGIDAFLEFLPSLCKRWHLNLLSTNVIDARIYLRDWADKVNQWVGLTPRQARFKQKQAKDNLSWCKTWDLIGQAFGISIG